MSFIRVHHLKEIAPLVDNSYNAPRFTAQFSKNDFEAEVATVHEKIQACMERAEAATSGLAEDGFGMGEPFANDRAVIVVVHYMIVLSRDLLDSLQRILVETPEDYLVILDGGDEHGGQYYITISKNEILGYAKNSDSLTPLGFA